MKKLVFLAPLLLATMASDKLGSLFEAPQPEAVAARPAARPTAAKGTKSAATVADVVTAANAFLASLSTAQQATLVQTFNQTNVAKWSNLPVSNGSRLGLRLDALTAAQQTLALAVVEAATGTVGGEGFREIQEIRAADDNLVANGGGSAYGSGVYLIAFLGQPSLTGTWMLQFGGHHLATNICYRNGYVTGPTPKFEATEPLTFTTANANVLPTGTVVTPLGNEATAIQALFAGLTTAQRTTARLSQTFTDVVLGPNGNGQFPTTRLGLPGSQLTAAQQTLVMNALRPWVLDADDATGAQLLSYYETQLANTYISYSGTGLFTSNADYARIDGPNVWIEFVCQSGVIYRNQIHYHSIYRDRARDYGGNFYTTALGTQAAATQAFAVYPNPAYAGSSLQVQLETPAASATYTLRNMLGQRLSSGAFSGSSTEVATTGLAIGTYLLSIEVAGQSPMTRKVLVY
ncbi:DUF3500 domain-containing protein [Hymenobacter sp. ASUV-10]|uniref:DUF3500 domain-containing protein n=1 Tax=Hymenobacter aranciens TaxID=3063996 RepID=A0ABT9B8C4_9BACT|nr:DUF3500 domain-containing protein [Hymenobacter sp. ASUV-10]MDO7874443.1 DUF3500 domain-containing protein [Hymenobacter sp. ASUV-10]